MKEYVRTKPKDNIVVIDDNGTVNARRIYAALGYKGVILKLSYSEGEARWNQIDTTDCSNPFSKTFSHSCADAVRYALDLDWKVFEFSDIKEFAEWLLSKA